MNNTPERAEFWQEFICTKCHFPVPDRLRSQFANAKLSEFCDCGCNSFKVSVDANSPVETIAGEGGYGTVFEAFFRTKDDELGSLELFLFADERGNLAYVEIDYCGNSYPVPNDISVVEPPYHVSASKSLLLS